MIRLKYFTTIIICLWMAATSAWCDDGKLYTADNMSSSNITCVTQDSYGFLWVGTGYGLNRFDGYQFVKYFMNTQDTTSLVSNEITTFLVDKKHRLWIGSRRGLVQYGYDDNTFRRYKFPDDINPRVTSLVEDKNGNIFIGTSGHALFMMPAETGTIVKMDKIPESVTSKFIGKLFIDNQGNLWCSSLNTKVTRISHPDKNIETKEFISDCGPVVGFTQQDQRGFYLVCMYGLLYYDYLSGKLSQTTYDLSALAGGISIRDAYFDKQGNLYVGTSGMGLMTVPSNSKTLQAMENTSVAFDLTSANVDKIFEDRNDNLWISCNKKGLYQLRRSKNNFYSWRFSTQNYKLGSSVSSIAPGKVDDVLCVVHRSGIYQFNNEGKILQQLNSPEAPITLFRDRKGKYWLGTENALYEYEPYSGQSRLKLRSDGWGIVCISDDNDGHLFLGIDGKGLLIYDQNTGKTEQYSMSQEDKGNGVLVNNWIRALYYDSRGLLWIGTVSGIGCMDPHSGNFHPLGWDRKFKGQQCFALYETQEGNMLIGTEAGLYRYDRQTSEFDLFPGATEMRNKSIYSIVTDRMGDLWMSTVNGIWHYDTKRQSFDSYVYGDGLDVHEYVVGARITPDDGRIMFGNNDGITVFYPHIVKGSGVQLGEVYLTAFTVDGKPFDSRERNFELSSDQNAFVMEFSLLDFRKTDNITFYYRVNGSDWVPIPEGTHVISFNNMKSGTYNIEVRATSNGSHSTSNCKLKVVVRPPFYLTWWAIACYFILGLALAALLFYYFEQKRKKKTEEDKMKFLINTTHDIRSPLTLIMSPLKKLQARSLDKEMQNDLQVIDRNAKRILSLVNQILDVQKIDKQQMHLLCRKTDLREFVKVVCKVYENNAQERNITFTFNPPANPVWAWIDRTQFDKVLSNLLSNAFKYSFDNGNIEITLAQGHDSHAVGALRDYVEICVIDNGTGMSEDSIPYVFNRFYQGKNSDVSHVEGTGIGLHLCKMIVDMHHGSIQANNRTDGIRGSVFTVRLPQGTSHLTPAEIEAETTKADVANTTGKHQPHTSYRVLIVDDDEEIGQYISNELGNNYHFSICYNGREAIHELLTNHYDVVIADVMMPEMDGFTLLRLIKTNVNLSHIPVIMLTSLTNVGNRLEGLKKGADAYLNKPFVMDELHLTIDNLIANHLRLKGLYSGTLKQEGKVENVDVKGNNEQLMERIMESINKHLDDNEYNIETLCNEVGISRAHLHRKMKEMTGISISEFIRNLRLEQAARLLKEQKLNVTQVAFTVGFNNQSHFSTVFRKYFGMSPSEFVES